ncbi:MAG: tetratricopeptide repeat protein [Candidatus Omnitrophota bacterium]
MPKTKLTHKIFLVVFGLFLTALLLEISLRLGGAIFLLIQERGNRASTIQNNEYRILCLGESTTALGGEHSYPKQLEKILNASQEKITFSVINKGIPAVTTTHIATQLTRYLDEYKPHMVVTMMGINDGSDLTLRKNKPGGSLPPALGRLYIYKLIILVQMHLEKKFEDFNIRYLERGLSRKEAQLERAPTAHGYVRLSSLYRIANRQEKAKEKLLKALELDPRNFEAWGYLGLHYKRYGEYAKAAEYLKKMLELAPDTPETSKILAYEELAECYKFLGEYAQAEQIYKASAASYPRLTNSLRSLAELYLEQGKYAAAEELLVEQINLNPSDPIAYGKLAHCYRRKGAPAAAERLLRQAIKINPQSAILYVELGTQLLYNKKYEDAEKILQQAIALEPENLSGYYLELYNDLVAAYEAQGKIEDAKKLKKPFIAGEKGYELITYRNYSDVRKRLEARGIKMVAVQYPLRDIKPLKDMLYPAGDILFVDNRETFEKAIAGESFDEYFTDTFAGNFGHCTAKGNHLLAANIAQTILTYLHPPAP